jgi:IS5 family transposase
MSDESVLEEWFENPYWQYFTGGVYFEYAYPADQSSMSRWRKKLAKGGAEKLLEESLKTGWREGFIKRNELKRVNVDTTMQEKSVRYPTDARLYDRMRERLVKEARRNSIDFRQTYERIGK